MSKNTNLSFLTDYITADITNGRIGINNASPSYAFDVTGIARTSTSTYLATSSGNVGIGTTTASSLLTLSQSAFNKTTLGDARVIRLENSDPTVQLNSRQEIGFGYSTAYQPVVIGHQITNNADFTNGSFYIAVRSGITNSAPTQALTVVPTGNILVNTSTNYNLGNDGNKGIIINSAAGLSPFISFRVGDASRGVIYANNAEMLLYAQANIPMIFGTNDTERMRILSGGNVGIGTTTPGQKLDVNGNIRAAGAFVQATGNIFVGDWTGFFDVSTSTSKVYLLQLVPTDSIPLLNYRLFGVIQTNTTSGTYYFTSIASQTMEVRFVGNTIQARITNGNGYYFNWSITQLC